jgi:uncharacterized protein (TIGR02266 family)
MPDSAPHDHPERRSFPRLPLEVEIGFHSETNFYAGLSQDISAGGIFVATHELMEIGTQVSVSFALPAVGEIKADGKVVWVRQPLEGEPGIGIRFEQLADADRALIERFIEKRPPLYHEEELTRSESA